jgi:pyruvate formate lyase activating enzyme
MDIKGNSLDDGPGIRSVIFFKGCPLRCSWCQNPESQQSKAELSYDKEKCIGCGCCVDTCSEQAIAEDNPFFIDRQDCNCCFECVGSCPSNALKSIGKEMGVEDIVQQVLRYKAFFVTSGGGVTLSGGEPTLYMDFSSALLKRFKAEGIHTLVETCGFFDMGRFETDLLPWIDTVYLDIKMIDPTEHRQYCGVSNDRIIHNFLRLNHLARQGHVALLPRTPLIPGITDTTNSLEKLVAFYNRHSIQTVSLLGNNPIWFNKCDQLGIKPSAFSSPEQHDFYSREKLAAIKNQFSLCHIEVI